MVFENEALKVSDNGPRANSAKTFVSYLPQQAIRACSFGHLKSAKSSALLKTVGFAEKNFSYQKNGNSENGRVGRLRRERYQKNTNSENGRVGRLRREKCQKNGNGMLKK